jgi:hypothetical protein
MRETITTSRTTHTGRRYSPIAQYWSDSQRGGLAAPIVRAHQGLPTAVGNTRPTSTYGGSTATYGGSAANNSAASDDCAAAVNSTTVVGASTARLIVRVTIATAGIRAAHSCRAANDGSPPNDRSTAIRYPTANPYGASAIRNAAASSYGASASCARRKGFSRNTRDPERDDRSKGNNSAI